MNRIMMKKVITTALAGAMAFSITACGSAGAAGKETAASTEATAAQEMTDNSAGGWELNTGALSIDENSAAKTAFQKAIEGMVGYEYEAIALLGTQVVAGTNYSILVKGNAVVPDAQPVYEIITIYEDLEGNARITDSRTLTDGEEEKTAGGGVQGFENAQIPNPFEDFAALEGAADAAGFELSVPDAPQDYQTVLYRASADDRGNLP